MVEQTLKAKKMLNTAWFSDSHIFKNRLWLITA